MDVYEPRCRRQTPMETRSGNPWNPRCCWILLSLLWLFHACHNVYWLLHSNTPPSYDCGYHLQLSINFYERLSAFGEPEYFKKLFFSSSFYPWIAYTAAVPFYFFFGIGQDSANAGNLIFLGLLIGSTYEIGRTLRDSRTGLLGACLLAFFPFVYGISRVYYIETGLMAVTAFAVLRLLRTDRFSDRKQSFFFGVATAVGLMTKWTFVFFLIAPTSWVFLETLCGVFRAERDEPLREKNLFKLGCGFFLLGSGLQSLLVLFVFSNQPVLWSVPVLLVVLGAVGMLWPSRSGGQRFFNMVLAGSVAVVLSYPWYVPNWDFISGIAQQFLDAEQTGQGSIGSLRGLLYYPFAMESNLLGPAVFAGFLLSIGLFPWRQSGSFAVILTWILGSYFFVTSIPFRDPRHIAPFLPAIALFMATACLSLKTRFLRRSLVGILFLGAFWQFGLHSYNLPFPEGNHFRLTRWGHFYSFWNHGTYGRGEEIGRKWPHEAIADAFEEAFRERISSCTAKPRLRCLVDRPFLHQGVFQFLARARRACWESVFDRQVLPPCLELARTLDSEAILFAESYGYDDLYHGIGGRKPFEYNRRQNAFFRLRFPDQRIFELPDGTTVTLAFRSDVSTIPVGKKVNLPFDSGVRLVGVGSVQVESASTDLSATIEVTWFRHKPVREEPCTVEWELWSIDGTRLTGFGFPFSPDLEVGSPATESYSFVIGKEFLRSAGKTPCFQVSLVLKKRHADEESIPVSLPGLGRRARVFLRETLPIKKTAVR